MGLCGRCATPEIIDSGERHTLAADKVWHSVGGGDVFASTAIPAGVPDQSSLQVGRGPEGHTKLAANKQIAASIWYLC